LYCSKGNNEFFIILNNYQILPRYEAKKESIFQDSVEPPDNPIDAGKSITGLGNKRKKSRYQTQRERLLERNRARERQRY
jgi:hypothetical protein